MIVSHARSFVFVKTRKTAGTSVELSLSRYCGPDDIITPVTPTDEPLRGEGPGPQHYLRRPRLRELEFRRDLRAVLDRRMPSRKEFVNHLPASTIRDRIGADVWDRYHTFCFTRNPWDYAVSRLFWQRHRKGADLTMDEVLAAWPPDQNWKSYTVDDEVIVDEVYDFGDIEGGLRSSLERVGIDFDGWLPRAKSATGRDKASYRDVLEPRHAELIAEVCAKEIAMFGYQY